MTDFYVPKVGDVVQVTCEVTSVAERCMFTKTIDGATNAFFDTQYGSIKLVSRTPELPKVGEIWETRFNSWCHQYEIVAISDTQIVVKYIKDNMYFVWPKSSYTAGENFFKVS